MPKPIVDYECPRCGYTTNHKCSMRQHLFGKKKMCPSVVKDIILTDDVKNYILDNRIYKEPEQKLINPVTNITNVTNNVLVNIVNDLNPKDKVQYYSKFINKRIKSLDDHICDVLDTKREQLEVGKIDQRMTMPFILQEIHDVTKCPPKNHSPAANIFFDTKGKALAIYNNSEWNEMLFVNGVKHIIENIIDRYFKFYELYLIRKSENVDLHYAMKLEYLKHLHIYYSFLRACDILPYILDKNDNMIKYPDYDPRQDDHTDSFEISEKYMKEYTKMKNVISTSEIQKIRKDLYDVVKTNAKNAVEELNKAIKILIITDDDFRQEVIKTLQI